jgi:hypothetical protein
MVLVRWDECIFCRVGDLNRDDKLCRITLQLQKCFPFKGFKKLGFGKTKQTFDISLVLTWYDLIWCLVYMTTWLPFYGVVEKYLNLNFNVVKSTVLYSKLLIAYYQFYERNNCQKNFTMIYKRNT